MPLRRVLRRAVGAACVLTLAAGLPACRPGEETSASVTTPRPSDPPRSDARGGRLLLWSLGPVATWDPQRMGSREDMAFATRTFARTLTAYAPSDDPARQGRLVGDLATDTGTASEDLRTWTFTLRGDATWQDGTPVTCDDVKYGISRTFATGELTGGPTYALALLDIPKRPDGTSVYAGPYDTGAGAAAGRAAFDRAVRCAGPTLTVRLSAPASDFNETVTLPAFGPYHRATDTRRAGTYAVFSNGPYQLADPWRTSVGGTWVRNPKWRADSDPIRKALPDEIAYEEGLESQTVAQRIMADTGDARSAVSLSSAPPALQQQIIAAGELRGRMTNPRTGLVDYLAPNLKSPVFAKPAARRALALATNRQAYVTALGGPTAAEPTTSLIPAALRALATGPAPATPTTPATPATPTTPATPATSSTASDAAQAVALLRSAGLTTPVPITVAYRSSDTADKAMAALVAGWSAAGFAPTLKPITDDYFTEIGKPTSGGIDVFWANWAPEWASAATVLGPVFDSRVNLSPAGTGRDFGAVDDPAVNAEISRLATVADRGRREQGWAALDRRLVDQGDYIALAQRRSLFIAGSSVRNFSADEAVGGYVELATIGAS